MLSIRDRLCVFALFGLLFGVAAQGQNQPVVDPVVARIAPQQCWLFVGWNSAIEHSLESENRAERILAEPEVRKFMSDCVRRLELLAPRLAMEAGIETKPAASRLASSMMKSAENSGCFYVESVIPPLGENPPEVAGALWLKVGDRSSSVASDLASLMPNEESAAVEMEIADRTFYKVLTGEPPSPEFLVGSVDEFLVVGLGRAELESAIQRYLDGKSPDWLDNISRQHGLKHLTNVCYLNARAIRDELLPMSSPEAERIVRQLGLADVEAVESVTGFSQTDLVNRISIGFSGQPSGLFGLFADRGIQITDLGHFPDDSLYAAALSLNSTKLLKFVRGLINAVDPDDAKDFLQSMARFREETGVDFERDILANLGSTWTIHNGAADGLLTGLSLSVAVANEEQLLAAMEGLIDAATEHVPPGETLFKRWKVGESNAVSIRVPDIPFPFEPSWTIVNGRLVVTLFPSSLKAAVGEVPFAALVDENLFQSMTEGQHGEDAASQLVAFSYTDTKRQFELLYPYVQMVLTMGQSMARAEESRGDVPQGVAAALDGLQLPPARVIYRHLGPSLLVMRRSDEVIELESRQSFPSVDSSAAIGVALGMLLPAVQQFRAAAQRTTSANNLRQLALAAHNYHDAHNHLPAGYSTNANGSKLLSWRVHVLPYLEQQALYEQFRLDEPWDSEHNKALIPQMPATFRSPNSEAEPGMTVYRGIGGKSGVMAGPKQAGVAGVDLRSITDGTSNTILFIETSDQLAVPWTQPDDGIQPDDLDPQQLFGLYHNGTNVTLCDGSVSFVSDTIDLQVLKWLMMMDDGEFAQIDQD
jgi:hypothetical protein